MKLSLTYSCFFNIDFFFIFLVDHRRNDIYEIITHNSFQTTFIKENKLFGHHTVPHEVIFYESQYSYAFTNIRCVVPGHVLVASKGVKPLLCHLSSEESKDLFETITRVEQAICKIHSTTSSTINIQNGKYSGQTIEHVHCHIMPRHKGDFAHNDMIYIELAKHDNPELELSEIRPISERVAEANIFRKTLNELFFV